MDKNRRFFWLWSPLIIYMAFMWFLSSQSGDKIQLVPIPFLDKVLHFLEYLIFGFLVARVISLPEGKKSRIRLFISVIVIALIWGAIDELHQSFVPLRDANLFDLIADCIGAGAGQFFCKL